MPMRYTGIRLLLVFVATNTVMILLLVTSMTSTNPWLAYVLPGQFQSGGDYTGYWVFFSLLLMVDAATVLIAALGLMLPAWVMTSSLDTRFLMRRLSGSFGISDQAIGALRETFREELQAARYQLFVGRSILLSGALFLVVAFAAMSLSFARAIPDGQMFARICTEAPCDGTVRNGDIRARDVALFTIDQITNTVLLDAPEIYDWHVGPLTNNTRNLVFAHFLFVFRTVFGIVALLMLCSLRFFADEDDAKPEGAAPSAEPGRDDQRAGD